MDKRSFIKKRDLIIILSVLFVCTAAVLIMNFSEGNSRTAEISVDGNVVKIIRLSGAPDSTFQVDGIENVSFSIKNEEICIINSDCHDKTCYKTGYIRSSTHSIICLPKKLMVKIADDNAGADVVVG